MQLYPPTFIPSTQPFRVAQVNPAGGDNLPLRVTGYNFHYTSAQTVSEAGIELIPVTFGLTAIEGAPVAPPALTINLLKDPNGKLIIASFAVADTTAHSSANDEKDCNEWPLYCKWKAIMAERMERLKSKAGGCHGHVPAPLAEVDVDADAETKPPHAFRPGHPHHNMGHGDHMRHHHGHHRMHVVLRRAFFTILIPVLVGVFAGTLTYLVGMALGCVVAVVLAKIRGRPAYTHVPFEDDEFDDEKGAELPGYEAPPGYVEKEGGVVDKE